MATLARTLRVLRDNTINIKWPYRPRVMDGWIGDESHQSRKSDHNENKRGMVNAVDIDTAQTGTTPIHVPTVIASMLIHPSTHYVIHKGRIMDRDDKYMPHRYTGSNRHDRHAHNSIRQTAAAENSATAYKFILKPMTWGLLKRGSKGQQVRELQAYLIGHGYNLAVDGDFGTKTDSTVRSFQRAKGIKVDGEVGPVTRAKLRPFK